MSAAMWLTVHVASSHLIFCEHERKKGGGGGADIGWYGNGRIFDDDDDDDNNKYWFMRGERVGVAGGVFVASRRLWLFTVKRRCYVTTGLGHDDSLHTVQRLTIDPTECGVNHRYRRY